MLSTLRSLHRRLLPRNPQIKPSRVSSLLAFSSSSSSKGSGKDNEADSSAWSGDWDGSSWGGADAVSSWSTGLTKEHFDGDSVIGVPIDPESQNTPQPSPPPSSARQIAMAMDEEADLIRMLEADNKESKKFVDEWDKRMMETYKLMRQVREPGVRGEYLKDSEKAEMYRLYKENPEVNTVEKLAMDYRVMKQRVHAILWLKEMEEEEEKKLGKPLDDSVEVLLDSFPE